MKSALAIFAVVMVLITSGCRSVRSDELVGNWCVSSESKRILPEVLQKGSGVLSLKSDGSFEASDLPGLLYFPPGPLPVNSGTGTWKLVTRDGKAKIQLDFANANGLTKASTTFVDVSQGSNTALTYYLGDPDKEQRVELMKTTSSSPLPK